MVNNRIENLLNALNLPVSSLMGHRGDLNSNLNNIFNQNYTRFILNPLTVQELVTAQLTGDDIILNVFDGYHFDLLTEDAGEVQLKDPSFIEEGRKFYFSATEKITQLKVRISSVTVSHNSDGLNNDVWESQCYESYKGYYVDKGIEKYQIVKDPLGLYLVNVTKV